MKHKNLFRVAVFITLPSVISYAQVNDDTDVKDSIPFFQKINSQYNNERDFTNQIYSNPASMSDYSISSFSQAHLEINNANQKTYRQPYGKDASTYGLETKSYQTRSSTLSLWGAASYTNIKVKDMKWGENLDYDRISPYSVADSVGGKIDIEKYHFLGGFAKKLNRFTIGLEGDYTAQLGARSRDPRNKTITSNLKVKFGTNYNFYKALGIGVFGQIEKYTQSNTINFSSLLGYPNVYQMTSFGYYNYLFSGGAKKIENQYEQLGYEVGGQFTSRNGRDFYILAKYGRLDLTKSTQGVYSKYYDVAEIEDKIYFFEGAKFLNLGLKQRIGLKLQYVYQKRLGSEFGYTNNTSVLEQVYKQKAFKRDDTTYKGELFYQLTGEKVTLAIMPFVSYQEFVEKRLRPFNGEKWDALTIGASIDFKLNIAEGNIFTLQPYLSHKSVSNHVSLLDLGADKTINDWVQSDYAFLSSDISLYGTSIRYDLKLNKMPGLYASFDWQNAKILNKNNTYTGFKVGVTF